MNKQQNQKNLRNYMNRATMESHVMKFFRQVSAVSVLQLSTRMGCSKSLIKSWETGHRKPSLKQLEKFVTVLNISMDDIQKLHKTQNLSLVDTGIYELKGKNLENAFSAYASINASSRNL